MPDMNMDKPQRFTPPASEMSDAVALQIAMQEAATPAWGTVALFFVEISMWATSGYAAITHTWPMWVCFLVSLVAIYMNYTPHHEAVHGSIAVFFVATAILGASLGGYAGLSQTTAVEDGTMRRLGVGGATSSSNGNGAPVYPNVYVRLRRVGSVIYILSYIVIDVAYTVAAPRVRLA